MTFPELPPQHTEPLGHEEAFVARETVRAGSFVTEIPRISHIAGNIYQGGVLFGSPTLPARFSHVVNLFGVGWFREARVPTTSMVVDMADSDEQDMGGIDMLARWVVYAAQDAPVLVHCQAGLNRSGAVVARALMMAYGLEAQQAIDTVRQRRSPAALCNEMFVRWLLGQE